MNAKPNAASPFRFFGLSALCFLLSALPLLARPNSVIRAFNEGVKLFNAKQFNEAIVQFDDVISSDSDFVEAYYARGACKYYLKSLEGALLDLNDALRLKSDYLDARALRGAVNYESDRWDAALEDFNAVLEKNPRDAQSLLGRAVILLKRENLDGAARDFKAFLRVRPDDPLAPKVRQLLASLSPQNQDQPPVARRNRPASSTASGLSSADLQNLADSLMGHPLSQSYDRKVLRGENAQAVGDFHSVPGIRTDRKASDEAPQIVDPQ